MKKLSSLLFLLINLSSFGQNPAEELPNYYKHHWKDTIFQNRQVKWENGKIKTTYKSSKGNTFKRVDYYESGNIKCEFEFRSFWTKDTTMVESVENPGTFIISVSDNYFLDLPHGKYIEYKEFDSNTISAQGIFNCGVRTGSWTFNNQYGDKISCNYNKNGDLSGKYYEYNLDGKKLCVGQYTIVKYPYYYYDPIKKDEVYYTRNESRKTGVWRYYDDKGKLMEIVKYKWKHK